MKRATQGIILGAVTSASGLLWYLLNSAYAYRWDITLFSHFFRVYLYGWTIYLETFGPSDKIFALTFEPVQVKLLGVWGKFTNWNYVGGFGFFSGSGYYAGIAVPLWAVVILCAMAAVAGRLAYRRLGRSAKRKRAFEVMRKEDSQL